MKTTFKSGMTTIHIEAPSRELAEESFVEDFGDREYEVL
jgi:hypothetical protein